MMMKVALLLLALAAPMISAGGTCQSKADALLKKTKNGEDYKCKCDAIQGSDWKQWVDSCNECTAHTCESSITLLQHNAGKYDCDCKDVRKVITDPLQGSQCTVCHQMTRLIDEVKDDELADICECLGLDANGRNVDLLEQCARLDYGPTYGDVGKGYGRGCLYDFGCNLHGFSYCTPPGEYGYGEWAYGDNLGCGNYEPTYNYGGDKFIAYDPLGEILYGYGEQYGPTGDLCLDKDYVPELYDEHLYRAERCDGYEPLCPEPVYKECEVYDWDAACADYEWCFPKEEDCDNFCRNGDYCPVRDAASSAAAGAGTETTVATVSYVLIAIAAALFLASIAFCAIGRRERKAHSAAENMQVNQLA